MADLKVFRVTDSSVEVLSSSPVAVERSLQTLLERHLEAFLGVRFLASEMLTTRPHDGRIDTLGLDESDSPVIIEYKRALNENVINQGLFYLDWLMDHRADFKLLVMGRFGPDVASRISWRYPRLVCVAGDFTKYDQYAVLQIPRNIELIRYRKFGDDLIVLEQVARSALAPPATRFLPSDVNGGDKDPPLDPDDVTVEEFVAKYSTEIQDWFSQLRAFVRGLGDDIEERVVTSSAYVAFRRLTTFAYFNFIPSKNAIGIDLPLPLDLVSLEPGFVETRQSWGKPIVRVWIRSDDDAVRAQPIIARSYERH